MGMIINPYVFAAATDADADAFISAAGITDATQQSAIQTLVTDLKGYGIWTKMKALYPFVGGTATTHKWNLKDPQDTDAAFRLVFSGGGTHSSTGWLPNGTNGYADTKLDPSSVLTESSKHFSYYLRTETTPINADPVNMGSYSSGGGQDFLLSNNVLGIKLIRGRLSDNSVTNTAQSTIKAHHIITRSSTTNKLFFNGTSLGTVTGAGNNAPYNTYIGALNFSAPYGYTNDEFAFASIGDGLTDTEAANFYTAVQAFQTTLSRNV